MLDAHTHLHDPRLDSCRDQVLVAAREARVTAIVLCGTSPADWGRIAALTATPPPGITILPAFGVHPWFIGQATGDWLGYLEQLLLAHPRAAVGEIGLDGIRHDLDFEQQRRIFEAQVELAATLRRPVNLHGARCWGLLADALQPHHSRLPGIILHAFAAAPELIPRFNTMGARFSFGGAICNPNARRVRAAAAAAPAASLLIETDAPDILPAGAPTAPGSDGSERLNHPANLALVARELAAIRGSSVAEIIALTALNRYSALFP